MTEWISVKDRLPGKDDYVDYTYAEDKQIHKDLWFDQHSKKWMQDGPMDFYGTYKGTVTHWRPRPQPPKD